MSGIEGLSQATLLCWHFEPDLVAQKPGSSASYINHATIKQRFLFVTGAPNTKIVDKLYSDVTCQMKNHDTGKKEWTTLRNVLVGVTLRMEVEIDGVLHVTEDFGSCEFPQNELHDGERAKKAASDAYKRCAMQLGNGLQMWAKGAYTLGHRMAKRDKAEPDQQLTEDATTEDEGAATATATATATEGPDAPSAAAEPDRPATGEQRSDAGQTASSAPHTDQLPGAKVTPATRCAACNDPIGDHTVKRNSDHLWVHRVCPRDKKKGTT